MQRNVRFSQKPRSVENFLKSMGQMTTACLQPTGLSSSGDYHENNLRHLLDTFRNIKDKVTGRAKMWNCKSVFLFILMWHLNLWRLSVMKNGCRVHPLPSLDTKISRTVTF